MICILLHFRSRAVNRINHPKQEHQNEHQQVQTEEFKMWCANCDAKVKVTDTNLQTNVISLLYKYPHISSNFQLLEHFCNL